MRTKLSLFCGYIIEAGWLTAVVSVPLFFNIYTARTFEPDKITLLRSIAAIMILAWLVMIVEQGFTQAEDASTAIADRLKLWLKRPLVLPVVLLVIVYIISTAFSISLNVSLWGSYQRLQGTYSTLSYIVIFALMAGNLRSREQVDRLITTMIITSVPVGLYGIVQRYGLDPLPWAGNVQLRVASTMGNAIFVASYLIMIVPLTVSRLVETMTAIVKDKESSWANTVLAAVYIFVIAVQILTVLFSGSRGPLIGLLAAFGVMGLLFLLTFRQFDPDSSSLSINEISLGWGLVPLLGIASAAGGSFGFILTFGLDWLFLQSGYEVENLPLLGAAIGGLIGFLGLYIYLGATKKGWRWMWMSWIGLAVVAVIFVVAMNLRGYGFDTYLDPIREIPYIGQLGRITNTEGGTGKVRVLIWDAALELIFPHGALGVEGDEVSSRDNFNVLRPLIGYGPESMFNAFAFVYPPDLAHVEARGSSADRSHNETVDSLVITGLFGFLAFYYLMISLFYYIAVWLGWAPDKSAQRRLIGLLILGSLAGGIAAYFGDGNLTFVPLSLPFGMVFGLVIHLVWQGIVNQPENSGLADAGLKLLFIGVLGGLIGHFLEVHFVFSIAATYTYFWAFAGLLFGLSRIQSLEQAAITEEEPASETLAAQAQESEPPVTTRRSRKRRGRRNAPKRSSLPATQAILTLRESWETWVGSQGLAMAIILIILTFDFITPQFEFSFSNENSRVFFWLLGITWLVGFAITLSNLALRAADWRGTVNWGMAVALYGVSSLFYFAFHVFAHKTIQFGGDPIPVGTPQDAIKAANVFVGALVIFLVFLLLLMMILAITLTWRKTRGLQFWRAENWWLYPPLALAVVVVIIFYNVNVVRADIYLKEGERYRNNQQWEMAIELHKKAQSIDSDEDFYYLMLALDYQLMAQDSRLDQAVREDAWQKGEQIALRAREINPYNPDNTGNMGRYYFTLGQIFNPQRFQDALSFFKKATELAPSNVIYHNLWAQTQYILQDYDAAIDRLQTSVAIDPKYAPTWLLLGDTYAATSNVEKALMAHTEAIQLNSGGSGDGFNAFADQFLDQRLNFYISSGRADDLIAALQQLAQDRPDEGRIPWVIGRIYQLQGVTEEAAPYFERAGELGEDTGQSSRELANVYLSENKLDQAEPLYLQLLQSNPNDVESHSALAFIYAQQGRLDEAIQHNQAVLQQIQDDYDTLKNLAILYQQNGQLQESLDFARQAQAVAPENDQASWVQFIANLENQLSANNN